MHIVVLMNNHMHTKITCMSHAFVPAIWNPCRSLLVGSLNTSTVVLREVHYDLNFCGYSIGALFSSGPPVLALGNAYGSIKLMRLDGNGRIM